MNLKKQLYVVFKGQFDNAASEPSIAKTNPRYERSTIKEVSVYNQNKVRFYIDVPCAPLGASGEGSIGTVLEYGVSDADEGEKLVKLFSNGIDNGSEGAENRMGTIGQTNMADAREVTDNKVEFVFDSSVISVDNPSSGTVHLYQV